MFTENEAHTVQQWEDEISTKRHQLKQEALVLNIFVQGTLVFLPEI